MRQDGLKALAARGICQVEEAMKSDQRIRADFLQKVPSARKRRELAEERAGRRGFVIETIMGVESWK